MQIANADPAEPSWAQARQLVLAHGWNALSYQILNPGMHYWFAPDRQAVAGYIPTRHYRIVAAGPIGAAARQHSDQADFEADTIDAGQHACYFGLEQQELEHLAADQQGVVLLLGAQPCWDPTHWPHILGRKASLRAQIARAKHKGVQVAEWPASTAKQHPALRQCLAEWLQQRGLPALHFLVEPDLLGSLHDRRVLVASDSQGVKGFLIATPIPQRQGWLIEQIIRRPSAPNGTAELLIDATMRQLAAEGSYYLTFGLAPLSQHAYGYRQIHPFWVNLIWAWMRIHGQRFYNFRGLDTFKAKLQPDHWEPIYALIREPRLHPQVLYAITAAFAGQSPLTFGLHTLARAARQELRWLKQRIKPLQH
ncbi:MAG: hypothetical protein Fur005_22160 [Roseiflexaceae bacterium]